VRGRLSGHRQPDLAAEGRKARIVLVAQDEGVIEETLYASIVAIPGPIEPIEGLLRIVAKRVNLRDLEGSIAGILLDQRLECRIGRAAVRADLQCGGEGDGLPRPGRLLLSGGERCLRVAAPSKMMLNIVRTASSLRGQTPHPSRPRRSAQRLTSRGRSS
jgi:hypothetical protein